MEKGREGGWKGGKEREKEGRRMDDGRKEPNTCPSLQT